MKTLIIGLGNPILTDDGVGVLVARAVSNVLDETLTQQVTVTEACVGGLRLMEMMVGCDRVILIDALVCEPSQPGAISRLTLDDLRAMSPTQHTASAHDTTLTTALTTGKRMGLHLPREVIIFAVAVENVFDFSDCPTPAVRKAIPEVTKAVLSELKFGSSRPLTAGHTQLAVGDCLPADTIGGGKHDLT